MEAVKTDKNSKFSISHIYFEFNLFFADNDCPLLVTDYFGPKTYTNIC